jgi:outer membrane lipoprotein SlyB
MLNAATEVRSMAFQIIQPPETIIMRIAKKFIVCTALLGSFASTSYGQNQTRDGALLGGVTGALIGGVVGKQNRETTEGALIGGAVGAIAGGVIGNQRDQAYRQQQYYHPQPTYSTYHEHRTYVQAPPQQRVVVSRRPVTTAEVINMTRSGVSEAVIVAHIQSNGVALQPDVNDVILMNQEGVSDYVVNAMQSGGRVTTVYQQPTTVYRTYPQPTPVVVREEYHYPQPVYQARQPSYRPYYVERRGF